MRCSEEILDDVLELTAGKVMTPPLGATARVAVMTVCVGLIALEM